jgi:hypothetical protein
VRQGLTSVRIVGRGGAVDDLSSALPSHAGHRVREPLRAITLLEREEERDVTKERRKAALALGETIAVDGDEWIRAALTHHRQGCRPRTTP